MNLQETIRRILREETSSQEDMRDIVSDLGLYNAKKMVGGIDNLYKILRFTGTREEMIFIVKSLMEHEVPLIDNICDFRIQPTQHSINLYVEIPKDYPNLPDDHWGNKSKTLQVKDRISNLIWRLGNELVRDHNVYVQIGKCQNEEDI